MTVMLEAAAPVLENPFSHFRQQPEVEKKNKIEGLPPTPISPDAAQRLENWGVPVQFIEKFRVLVSSFRYDLVVERSADIAKRGGYIHTDSHYQEEVLLPNYASLDNRGDGMCLDISVQLMNLIVRSGILKEINAALQEQGKKRIDVLMVEGRSRTHFNKPRSQHVWLGLLPQGEPTGQMVTVDGSFQEISLMENNGYQMESASPNPRELTYKKATNFLVGKYERSDASISFSKEPLSQVIGLSADKKFIYGLGFITSTNFPEVHPYISIIDAESTKGTVLCILEGKEILLINGGPEIEEKHLIEIKKIFLNLQHLQLSRNESEIRDLQRKETRIQYSW